MNKNIYIKEITNEIELFDTKKLKELFNFVKFLKYQDYMDPTLEIISNDEWYKKTKLGIEEMMNNDVVEWDSLK
jgi:hypothetical protein